MSMSGAAGSGQREIRQTGMEGLGGGLADPWVTKGKDPCQDNRVNTGLGPIGSYVNVPCPPSSASSAASGCANMGADVRAPLLCPLTEPWASARSAVLAFGTHMYRRLRTRLSL